MRLLLALLALGLVAPGALATVPSELTEDPLDRGALVALPGVYRLEAEFDLSAVESPGGERVAISRPVTVVGTAFGIATGGWILTADHLVNGTSATLAVAAVGQDPDARAAIGGESPEEWVERTGGRPVEAVAREIRLRHVESTATDTSLTAVLEKRQPQADMALLRTDRVDAPALELDDSQSVGTPVVTIGFGADGAVSGGSTDPALRPGELASTGTISGRGDRLFTQVTSDVQRGDSGGPAVDSSGRVRGMVITRAAVGANLVPGIQIRSFVGADRIELASGTQESYREGLASFWSLDFPAAESGMARALEAYPDHPLAERFAQRSTRLRTAPVTLDGPNAVQSFLLALAFVSAVISLGLAALLVRHDMSRRAPRPLTATFEED